MRIQQSPQQEQIPSVLISPPKPDLNPKEIFFFLYYKIFPCSVVVHCLQQINQLLLKDAGGSRGKVAEVVCLVYYLHGGPEKLGQEGKGLSALKELCS